MSMKLHYLSTPKAQKTIHVLWYVPKHTNGIHEIGIGHKAVDYNICDPCLK